MKIMFCVFLYILLIFFVAIPVPANLRSSTTNDSSLLLKSRDKLHRSAIVLPIPPVMQQTAVWCWLAVGEMVFRYHGIPTVNPVGDYQCGIVGAIGYALNGPNDPCNQNCGNCVRPAGSHQMISYMFSQYPRVAGSSAGLNTTFVVNYLSPDYLIQQLNAEKPIVAGINPGSFPNVYAAHVALIVGFYYSNDQLVLLVNDPYPYYLNTNQPNPYLSAGGIATDNPLRYAITFNSFVSNLGWTNTWCNF